MRALQSMIWVVSTAIILTACSGSSPLKDMSQTEPAPIPGDPSAPTIDVSPTATTLEEQLRRIMEAIADWRNATSIEAARSAAETAANLVVGPNGPDYGDRNGDGVISGATAVGVLPGLDGTPTGLATPLAKNDCIARDVLGGTWSDPGAEWDTMLTAINDWRAGNNTMPSLASHPMRIVGWATFTLRSDSLDKAHEYAGHAELHVDVALRTLDC